VERLDRPAAVGRKVTAPIRIGEWKSAWNVARSTAKLKYRWQVTANATQPEKVLN
jgi:hypothetical protein